MTAGNSTQDGDSTGVQPNQDFYRRNEGDRLYKLLPAIYQIRDAEQGEPLKALLQVINEQVSVVEEDITRLYDNWFIETCEDWVVPYIADLIGYRRVHEAGELGEILTEQGRAQNRILVPRREVANTIRYRRRKGTLSLLELLANDIAGWPARAVEYYKLLGWTQALNYLHLERGRTVDLRCSNRLEMLGTPFDDLAHTVDVRRINSQFTVGRHNIPSVGIFIWRLKSYSVTQTPAHCIEAAGPHRFTFSVLGNDIPLFVKPEPEMDPTHIGDEFNLPVPIRRNALVEHKNRLYGEGKSLYVWTGAKRGKYIVLEPVPAHKIVPADLSGWKYLPRRGTVAVDPLLGRIAFPAQQPPKNGVWVSYHYGFSGDIGGGEYDRSLSQPERYELYCVSQDGPLNTLAKALDKWREGKARHVVIEIDDSRVYAEPVHIEFLEGQESLQLRAANGKRPIIRLLDWQTNHSDALTVSGKAGGRFILDGVMVAGQGVQASGELRQLIIRHSTLVPGWSLDEECGPQRPTEPSLEVFSPNACVIIERSILGSIQINPIPATPSEEESSANATEHEVQEAHCKGPRPDFRLDPVRLCISDSIVDATSPELEAIGAPGCPVAYAAVIISRCTVFGQIHVHKIELGENCIFRGRIAVARRQLGCVRFSYVTPGSRTPSRFMCQPDLVESSITTKLRDDAKKDGLSPPTATEIEAARRREQSRVIPQFNSQRYGTPAYCQLSLTCAHEIKRGADDESEMGVFHDLFQPQREANLRVRLDEYLPAGADVGVIFAT